MKRKVYLGVDVGSVSTNFVLMNEADEIVEKLYLRTLGQPIKVIQEGLKLLTNLGEWKFLGLGLQAKQAISWFAPKSRCNKMKSPLTLSLRAMKYQMYKQCGNRGTRFQDHYSEKPSGG